MSSSRIPNTSAAIPDLLKLEFIHITLSRFHPKIITSNSTNFWENLESFFFFEDVKGEWKQKTTDKEKPPTFPYF